MIIWIYLAVLFISFLGLIVGIELSSMAAEEIKHASKYLKYLNMLLPSMIILAATYRLNKLYSIIFAVIIMIVILLLRKRNNDAWIYSSMSALLYVSVMSEQTFNVAIIIFIYGISISTVNASKRWKNKNHAQITRSENKTFIIDTLKNYFYYLIIGILFFGVFSYIL